MDNSESRARGEQMYREIVMMEPPEQGDLVLDFAVEEVYGRVWTRPGLTRKERRWISLSVVAMSGPPSAIKSHVSTALRSGDITPEEMMECVVHFAHYGGWPRAVVLYGEVREAIAALNSSDTK